MEKILESFREIQQRIAEAKSKAPHGRDVRLVAVSKRQPLERIKALQEALGDEQLTLGENYVQEYRDKRESLLPHRVHLIGALQSNKAKDAVALFDCIESVHSEKVARALEKEAQKREKMLPVLLQINISDDPQKSGLSVGEFQTLAESWNEHFANLKLRGGMAITAYRENPEDSRDDFRRLYQVVNEVFEASSESFEGVPPEVSMGMSADYHIAIEEGATLVRVGSALFGERPPLPQ